MYLCHGVQGLRVLSRGSVWYCKKSESVVYGDDKSGWAALKMRQKKMFAYDLTCKRL